MTGYFLLTVLLSAAITFLLRALPFLAYKERKMPDWMKNLGGILPSAIMAVLIVYCLRSGKGDPVHNGIPGLISVFTVALSYKWRHNTFLSIITGTAIYMFLIRIV